MGSERLHAGTWDWLWSYPCACIEEDNSTCPPFTSRTTISTSASDGLHDCINQWDTWGSNIRYVTTTISHLVPKWQSIRLIKALYGLKKAPRVWNAILDTFLRQVTGMTPCGAYRCLYSRCKNVKVEMVMKIYVDGILLLATDAKVLNKKDRLKTRFEIKGIGMVRWYLGMSIIHTPKGIWIDQCR